MLYIEKFSIWKPSAENLREMPKLEYADSLFKRRLSQISRMTIEVLHEILQEGEDLPLIFASSRGEIARQFKINRGLCEDGDVLPAQFSLSTFNVPPAVSSIALKLKSGYTAIYPRRFSDAILAAAASILAKKNSRVIFAFADEKIPSEYEKCSEEIADKPFALACIISEKNSAIPLDSFDFPTAQSFVRFLESK